jgi:ribosomal protein L39E
MVLRYETLKKPITDDLKKLFKETKLMVLNPQAHFQDISLPIYKVELEKAFELIKLLKQNYPIPQYTIALSKGMKMQFKHPTARYTFDFELSSDFFIENLNGTENITYPKCIISSWQFNNRIFWDFIKIDVVEYNSPIDAEIK